MGGHHIRLGAGRPCIYHIIPYNSIANTGKVHVFGDNLFFSSIEIDLYSFYRKSLIVTPKIREKIDRSPYSFTRNRQFISLAD